MAPVSAPCPRSPPPSLRSVSPSASPMRSASAARHPRSISLPTFRAVTSTTVLSKISTACESAGRPKRPVEKPTGVGLTATNKPKGRTKMGIKNIDRRTFMRGSAAAAAALPLSGLLGSTSALAQDAANPFGLADGSAVDAVIFNGGYGIDYVEFAANLMQKNHPKSTVKVSASTKIATELQPRFIGGNPPDLIDNSGADAIGFSAIIDQLETMDSGLDAPSLEGVK